MLRPVTEDNLMAVIRLSDTLTESQARCLAPNVLSVAQAYVAAAAWMRAIYLGEDPIGFVLVDLTEDDFIPVADRPTVVLWRFMIGRPWQRRGYGKEALRQVVDYFARHGFRTMYTSVVLDEPESPYPYYLRYGFTDTGVEVEGEQVLRLVLPEGPVRRPAFRPFPPRVDLVTVWVEDMDPMRCFYQDALGFLVKSDLGTYVEFDSIGVRLALCERSAMSDRSPAFRDPVRGQRFQLAFRCEGPEKVDEAYLLLRECGAAPVAPPQDTPGGRRVALFADPQGNVHELFADLGLSAPDAG